MDGCAGVEHYRYHVTRFWPQAKKGHRLYNTRGAHPTTGSPNGTQLHQKLQSITATTLHPASQGRSEGKPRTDPRETSHQAPRCGPAHLGQLVDRVHRPGGRGRTNRRPIYSFGIAKELLKHARTSMEGSSSEAFFTKADDPRSAGLASLSNTARRAVCGGRAKSLALSGRRRGFDPIPTRCPSGVGRCPLRALRQTESHPHPRRYQWDDETHACRAA